MLNSEAQLRRHTHHNVLDVLLHQVALVCHNNGTSKSVKICVVKLIQGTTDFIGTVHKDIPVDKTTVPFELYGVWDDITQDLSEQLYPLAQGKLYSLNNALQGRKAGYQDLPHMQSHGFDPLPPGH